MNVFLMGLTDKTTGNFITTPEVFSSMEKAEAEATFLYVNASLPEDAPNSIVWVDSTAGAEDGTANIWTASHFESDSDLTIHEVIVDFDQPDIITTLTMEEQVALQKAIASFMEATTAFMEQLCSDEIIEKKDIPSESGSKSESGALEENRRSILALESVVRKLGLSPDEMF
jgi:hypothetical protein